MRTLAEPGKALALCSVFGGDFSDFASALLPGLTALMGEVVYDSGLMPFNATLYYEPEFGPGLKRRFLGFGPLVSQDPLRSLVPAKLGTVALEKALSLDGRRRYNLDPGFINHERLVLATGKNYTHRIYLGEGVFADLTLIRRRTGFVVLPWTFPDYALPEVQAHLEAMRDLFGRFKAAEPDNAAATAG